MKMPTEIDTKLLLKYSPAFFINRVYGYKVDGCHSQMLDHMIDNKFSLTLVSRGHGKSRMAGGYLTYLVCNNPNLRTILVSDTYTKSVLFLKAIKQTIESSPVIKEFYGDLRGSTWSDNSITIKGRDKTFVEPSILAVGAGSGQIVGMHANKIIVDDLVSFDSSRSELQRTRDKSWFKTNLIPVLMSSGSINVIGTRYHPQDFYQMVIDDLKYKTLILPALNDKNEPLCSWLMPYEDKLNSDGEMIQKGLKRIREELGLHIWQLQFMNDVTLANEDHIIKYDYIQYYDSIEYIDNQLFINGDKGRVKIGKINLGVDPAISEKESADSTAMVVIGKGADSNYYVLDTLNKHLTMNNQIKAIQELVGKWQVNQTLIEDVAYQKALIQELKRLTGLKIVPITPTRDKTSRLNMVSGHFEAKRVHFKKNMNQVVSQLIEFPDGSHDDLVDATVYSLWGFKTASSGLIVLRM